MYADALRERFPDLDPVVEDLFLLEPHQIACLPERAPGRELSIVMQGSPELVRFFSVRYPPIRPFLAELLDSPSDPESDVAEAEDRLLWEIADLIVYQRAPAMYDARAAKQWTRAAFEEVEPLEGKVVIDAGAGTGHVTFAVAEAARTVFAVEPATTLRAFMREKAADLGFTNVFVIDGFLHAIPLPAGSADLLLTHRAIGWKLGAEIEEINRVVRSGGAAMHLTGLPYPAQRDAPLHDELLANAYEQRHYREGTVMNRKYYKRI